MYIKSLLTFGTFGRWVPLLEGMPLTMSEPFVRVTPRLDLVLPTFVFATPPGYDGLSVCRFGSCRLPKYHLLFGVFYWLRNAPLDFCSGEKFARPLGL